jgi:hypothetical protein
VEGKTKREKLGWGEWYDNVFMWFSLAMKEFDLSEAAKLHE